MKIKKVKKIKKPEYNVEERENEIRRSHCHFCGVRWNSVRHSYFGTVIDGKKRRICSDCYDKNILKIGATDYGDVPQQEE